MDIEKGILFVFNGLRGQFRRNLVYRHKHNRDYFFDPTEDIKPSYFEKKYDSHVHRYYGHMNRKYLAERLVSIRKKYGHKYVPHEYGNKRKNYFKSTSYTGEKWGYDYHRHKSNSQGIFGPIQDGQAIEMLAKLADKRKLENPGEEKEQEECLTIKR